MEQSLLADHERQFATPHYAWHKLLAANRTQATNRYSTRPAVPAKARRHEPKAGADLGARTTQAVRSRTAGKQSQRLEVRTLKRLPAAQARELA
jgi:hypothetical protein